MAAGGFSVTEWAMHGSGLGLGEERRRAWKLAMPVMAKSTRGGAARWKQVRRGLDGGGKEKGSDSNGRSDHGNRFGWAWVQL
jgi:hypothetical protein